MEKIICEERSDEGLRTFKDNICGTIRSEKESGGDKRVIEVNRLGNIYGEDKGTGFAGNVWDDKGLCPTITTMQGGNREPMIVEDFYKNRELRVYDETAPTLRSEREGLKVIVASRGRGKNPDNPSDKTKVNYVEQRLEPNSEGICNTLTTVQKDNLVLETNYRIRKLTPKECWRLMAFTDEDFHKAEEVNSNTQLYKQAGNSL